MSVRVMGKVWDLTEFPADPDPDAAVASSSALKLVLLAIADHADHDGGNAWPSIDRLATMTGLARRTVQRAISSLGRRGLLEVRDQAGGDADTPADRRPNRYKLTLDAGRHPDTPDPVDNPETGRQDDTPRGATMTERGANHDTTGRQGGAQTVLEPSRTHPTAPGSAGASEGELVASLLAECYAPDAQLTDIERGKARRAARDLERAGATAASITDAADSFRHLWPRAVLTPLALAGNWNLLTIAPRELVEDAALSQPADPDHDICGGSGWAFDPDGNVVVCDCMTRTTAEEA